MKIKIHYGNDAIYAEDSDTGEYGEGYTEMEAIWNLAKILEARRDLKMINYLESMTKSEIIQEFLDALP